jgi:hypothetical protein
MEGREREWEREKEREQGQAHIKLQNAMASVQTGEQAMSLKM